MSSPKEEGIRLKANCESISVGLTMSLGKIHFCIILWSKYRVYHCFYPWGARAWKREYVFQKQLSSPTFMFLKLGQTHSWEPRSRVRGILCVTTKKCRGVIFLKIYNIYWAYIVTLCTIIIFTLNQWGSLFVVVISCFSTDEESEAQSDVNNFSKGLKLVNGKVGFKPKMLNYKAWLLISSV